MELTVIMATYNAADYLEACLNSIVAYAQPCQLIIVDGASTDDTLQIIRRFDTYVDVLISEKDNGIYDAMNKALPHIKGKWVLFLGADDRLLPSFPAFRQQFKDERTLYYGNCLTDNKTPGGPFSRYRLAKMNACHQAICYPREVFAYYNYQTQYPVFSDYALNIQCWGDARFRKQYLPVDVAYFNIAGFSAYGKDEAFRRDKPALVRRYLGWRVYLRYRIRKLKESRKKDSQFF